MAGVTAGAPAPKGPFSPLARAQYAALASMRWSMFRNGIRSPQGAMEFGARGVVMILYSIMGIGLAVGLGGGAFAAASDEKWFIVPVLFWVVFVLWQIVPVSIASFQQQFDLGGLLRFPVSFGAFFLLHMIFGLVDASTIMGGFCCAGIWAGLALARPGLLGWTTLALVVFAAFNIFLVRTIFAWIERWLAKRRSREIVMAVFFLVMLSMNFLNPAFRGNPKQRAWSAQTRAESLRWMRKANAVQRWLPPGLAARMVRDGAQGRPADGWEAVALLGVFVVGTAGTLAARLRSEYRGESLGEAPSRKAVERRRGQWLLDGSGPIAAVMEKELRTLLRALPLLYGVGAPLLMVFLLAGLYRRSGSVSDHLPMALMLSLAYALVGFTQLLYNNLGGEGPGIQILFLSPTPIRTVLLAKNLFHALLFAIDAVLVCLVATWRLGAPSVAALAAVAGWVVFALPVHLATGNIFSLTMPYRLNLGRIGRQKGSQSNALLSMVVQLGVLGVGAGVVMAGIHFDRLWAASGVFLVLACGAVFAWSRVLAHVDRLANDRRDDLILALVKAE